MRTIFLAVPAAVLAPSMPVFASSLPSDAARGVHFSADRPASVRSARLRSSQSDHLEPFDPARDRRKASAGEAGLPFDEAGTGLRLDYGSAQAPIDEGG